MCCRRVAYDHIAHDSVKTLFRDLSLSNYNYYIEHFVRKIFSIVINIQSKFNAWYENVHGLLPNM